MLLAIVLYIPKADSRTYSVFPVKTTRFKCLTTSVFLTVDAAETTEVEAWEETSVRSRETSPYTSVDCTEKGTMVD